MSDFLQGRGSSSALPRVALEFFFFFKRLTHIFLSHVKNIQTLPWVIRVLIFFLIVGSSVASSDLLIGHLPFLGQKVVICRHWLMGAGIRVYMIFVGD